MPLLIAATLTALMFGVPIVATAKRERSSMDPATGTMLWETRWFGYVTESHLIISPLENRLIQLNALPPRTWQFIHERINGGYACGTAPPIYQSNEVLQTFVDHSSDAEVLGLVAILQSNADEETQRKAVDSAMERAFHRAGIR